MSGGKQIDKVPVKLADHSYDILIGKNLIEKAGKLMTPVLRGKQPIIITDQNLASLHLPSLRKAMLDEGLLPREIVLQPGETTKSFSEFESLTSQILDFSPDRNTSLVALGGGVIGDLTGFAASSVLRGIDFIQIPTSLLAQVDSSVGGKTGINTKHGKNLIGSFHQPRLVIADTEVLNTLPRRQLIAGYAEVAKYGLIGDKDFFEWLEKNGPDVIEGIGTARRYAIATSCRAKAKLVVSDERERGKRALLNLGHTFGHALEKEIGFDNRMLHGEAVGIGIKMAFDLSVRMGICPFEEAYRACKHLEKVGLGKSLNSYPHIIWTQDRLMANMSTDKKVIDGNKTFILMRGIGKAFACNFVKNTDLMATLGKAIAR